ncbi:MAG: hypothetical protein FWC10_06705 [Lentimicrobiaceae bacterium]|nr:hypothetical protein [Lentimicrobiaceae bacterium]
MFKSFIDFLLRTLFREQDYIVGYDGDTGEEIRVKGSDFKESMRGTAGASAQIQFSANQEGWHFPAMEGDTYIRFRVGQGEWSVCRFVGKDGKNIELDVNEGYIVWRVVGDFNWQNLISLSDLGDSIGTAVSAKWLTGVGTPEPELGSIGDLYINTVNGDVYKKTGDSEWTFKLNIKGVPGDASTIEVGVVTTGEAGSNVIVENAGNAHNAVFDFTIPRGLPGEPGRIEPGSPYDFLITDANGQVKWLRGFMEIYGNEPNIEINEYAKTIAVNYTADDDLTLHINSDTFSDMQVLTIVVFNNRDKDLIVVAEGIVEWKDGDTSIQIPAWEVKEMSLLPYMIDNVLRIRGLKG